MKVKIAVLASGGGTNLQALLDAQKTGILKSGSISMVISNRKDAYALERAQNSGIKTAVVLRKECKTSEEFEKRIIDLLEDKKIDLIVLAGFMTILSADFTRRYEGRIINVHPSLIPAFCGKGYYGLKVHEAALARGVKVTGATVHFVNEVPDGGSIIMQKAVEVKDGDTAQTLQRRVMEEAEWKILPLSVEKAASRLAEK